MPMITCDLGHAYHGCASVFCVYYGYFHLPVFHVFYAPLFIMGLHWVFWNKGRMGMGVRRGVFNGSFVCLCTYEGLCGSWGNGLMMSDTMLK